MAWRDIDYDALRGDILASLNFIIPADEMIGHLRLHVQAGVPDTSTSDEATVSITATLHQTLRLAGIMVSYNGPDATGNGTLNLPAPSLADLITTSSSLALTMPVAKEALYRTAGVVPWNLPLNDPREPPEYGQAVRLP